MSRRRPAFRTAFSSVVCATAIASVAASALVVAPQGQAVPAGPPTVVATVGGTPWEIAVLPSGASYVVQRDGGIVYLDAQDHLATTPALARTAIPHVRKLLGLALAPDFATSGLAYLYVARDEDPDGAGPETGRNGIWRLRASGPGLATLTVVDQVFDGIGSDGNHDGGRMVFGPDGCLYVTTGDIHQPTRPQDPTSLNGKVLRLSVPATGPLTAPADNPYAAQAGGAPYVWSLGHRHPQGLAFDAAGRLWETEHGPTGEQHGPMYPGGNDKTGRDELNLIVRGGNYGWPVVSGPDNQPGMIAPAAVAGDSPAWAPGDLAVGPDGSLYAPFLAGARLHRFDVRRGVVYAQGDHLTDQGRLRVAVVRGSDLLVAQDSGDAAKIFRVPLGPRVAGGSDAADPPAAPGVPGAPGTPSTPPPASVGTDRDRVRVLAHRLARALHVRGRAGLLAGRPAVVQVDSPGTGRLLVELRLGSAQGPRLARVRLPAAAAGDPLVVRLRLRVPAARARLRAAGRPRLVVQVTYRPQGQRPVDGTSHTRLGRGRG